MEDPAARRARLKALKEAAETSGQAQPEGPADEAPAQPAADANEHPAPQEPVLKFRNYAPRDEKIEHQKVAVAKAPQFEEVQVDLDAAIGHDAEEVLINVAPKKANWDLRRDIAGKLSKLERRTQRAMIQLMGQEENRRLAAEGGQQD